MERSSNDGTQTTDALLEDDVGDCCDDADVLFRSHNDEGSRSVAVSGTWCGWSEPGTPLSAERDVFGRGRLFSGTIRLPHGKHLFRFIVDGKWRHDPQLLTEKNEETGELFNVVEVSPNSEFRVQMPIKILPDESAEAVDYMNSLKEYDLRIPRTASRPSPSSSLTSTPLPSPSKPRPSGTTAVTATAATTNASFLSKSGSEAGPASAVNNGTPREDIIAGLPAKTTATAATEAGLLAQREFMNFGHPKQLSNDDDEPGAGMSKGNGDLALDLEALGIASGDGGEGEEGHVVGGHIVEGVVRNRGLVDLASEAREQAIPKESVAYREREASVAAVGACLVTSSVRKDGKLLVAMVGLPARGKSFVARSIARHLDWVGLKCKIFSVGGHRRKEVGVFQPATYFDPGGEGEEIRKRMATEVLNEALEALKEDSDIAIYDASNITKGRRRWLADAVAASGLYCQVVFIESICNDHALVKMNVLALQHSSPEYKEKAEGEAELDFKARIEHYQRTYQPLEAGEGYRFIKLFDVGSQMVTNLISGYIPGRITLLCLNLHLKPRPIWMSRHGESEFNTQGRIGGNAPLTSAGKVYAAKLAEFMKKLYPPSSSRGSGSGSGVGGVENEELVVWTSTMLRTGQTVAPMTFDREVVKWSQLTEINAGLMDSLTYEYVAAEMPQEYEARMKDKLRYRYPGGESYQDLFARLEPVLFEMLRERSPLLVVGHQAILRVLYGYLTGKGPAECPTLHMPLHTAIKLTPKAYTCEEEWYRPLEECDNPIKDSKNPTSDDHSA